MAINEAMCCSCAILVSDKCGCAVDLVKNDVNGFIIKSNDLDDLKARMLNLSENKQKVERMRKASQDIIKDWSFENICKAIEQSF